MSADPTNRSERRAMRRRRDPAVRIRCIGGPFDGHSTTLVRAVKTMRVPAELDDETKVLHIYMQGKNTRHGLEYRFVETVPAPS